MDYQVSGAILTSLAAIVGDGGTNYWYTPPSGSVIRYHDFTSQVLDDSLGQVYCLVPDRVEREPHTNKHMLARAHFDLVMAKRVEAPDHPFSPPSTTRQQIQTRMAHDASKKLLGGDHTLGLARVITVDIPSVELGPEDTWTAAWAIAVLRLSVEYTHLRAAA